MIVNLHQGKITPDFVAISAAADGLNTLKEKVSNRGSQLVAETVVDVFDEQASFSIENQTLFDIWYSFQKLYAIIWISWFAHYLKQWNLWHWNLRTFSRIQEWIAIWSWSNFS